MYLPLSVSCDVSRIWDSDAITALHHAAAAAAAAAFMASLIQ